MKPDIIKKVTIRAVPAAVLIALSAYLLKGDVWTFWTWYLLAMVLGIVAMPLTGRLFGEFDDKLVWGITIANRIQWQYLPYLYMILL